MGHHWISCLILASCTRVVQFLPGFFGDGELTTQACARLYHISSVLDLTLDTQPPVSSTWLCPLGRRAG